MRLIVDASVVAKLFATETDFGRARARVEGNDALVAPELVLAEVFNTLWKKHRRGEISSRHLDAARAVIRKPFSRLIPISDLFDEAAELSVTLSHPIHDCLYLALASKLHALLLTADARLAAAAERAQVAVERL
jgi:predicted nucleic acid-binding protein